MAKDPRAETIQQLAQQLRCLQREPSSTDRAISFDIPALSRFFPSGGMEPGTLLEWLLQGEGSGAETLVFLMVAGALRSDDTLVVIDHQRQFYPPAAVALGINLDQTIIVRPGSWQDTLWALEQSLRCPGVAITLCELTQLDSRDFRRLQLAVETSSGIGMLLRPARFQSQPSWADMRFLTQPLPSVGGERQLRIELLRCRGRASGETNIVGINHETGRVRLVSRVAAAETLSRAARA